MKSSKQLQIDAAIEAVEFNWRDSLSRYMMQNREMYIGFAHLIRPTNFNAEEIYRRLAFSILSVQAPFARGCAAFASVCKLNWRDRQKPKLIRLAIGELIYKDVKTRGLVELAKVCDVFDPVIYLRHPNQSWHEYRKQLADKVLGLGKAKGSFAACLLYPLEADLACLDTWMLKRFGAEELNGKIPWEVYLAIEAKVREWARRYDVPTFIAQWMIWDHERGTMEPHSILMPGVHKD